MNMISEERESKRGLDTGDIFEIIYDESGYGSGAGIGRTCEKNTILGEHNAYKVGEVREEYGHEGKIEDYREKRRINK